MKKEMEKAFQVPESVRVKRLKDVIDMIATVYKWIDQSISFEWMLNPAETTPADLYNNYFHAWKSGVKTIYYLRSMSGEIKEDCISCSG